MPRNYPPGTFRNSIRAWRESLNLTLEGAVERVRELNIPTTPASLSRIERGIQNYDAELLYALAQAFGCEPSDLVMRRPRNKQDVELWSVITNLKPAEQEQLLRIAKALKAA